MDGRRPQIWAAELQSVIRESIIFSGTFTNASVIY